MASYDVEEILDSRKKGGKMEYLVRWAPTWESEKNLSCSKLLKEFKQKSGETEANGENDDNEEDTDEGEEETKANTSRRTPRKAAQAANRKRKSSQKSAKRSKRGRR